MREAKGVYMSRIIDGGRLEPGVTVALVVAAAVVCFAVMITFAVIGASLTMESLGAEDCQRELGEADSEARKDGESGSESEDED